MFKMSSGSAHPIVQRLEAFLSKNANVLLITIIVATTGFAQLYLHDHSDNFIANGDALAIRVGICATIILAVLWLWAEWKNKHGMWLLISFAFLLSAHVIVGIALRQYGVLFSNWVQADIFIVAYVVIVYGCVRLLYKRADDYCKFAY